MKRIVSLGIIFVFAGALIGAQDKTEFKTIEGVPHAQLGFFASGFGAIEQDGDYRVYREYRIKNLPEIFGK